MTNLKQTFEQTLRDKEMSKKDFALRHKLNASDISRFINQGVLSKPLKAVIFSSWESEPLQIALFTAYLADEIEAAGLTGKVKAVCYNDREYDLEDN